MTAKSPNNIRYLRIKDSIAVHSFRIHLIKDKKKKVIFERENIYEKV